MSACDDLPPDPQADLAAVDAATKAANGDDAELRRLAALTPIEYDRERLAAAERLSCRVTTLDDAVRRLRHEDASPDDGAATSLDRPEPWPEPVDGAALLNDISVLVSRYLVLPPAAADAVALWVLHTHCHDAADHAPVLAITSPEKRCGKTTLLHVITAVVPVPLSTANISAAAVFRAVERWRPTLLIDEADTFLCGDDDTLRGVLNSGHCRASAFVIRTVGDDHEPRRFSTWSPKVIAAIGSLPGALADRSIDIRLQRARPGDKRQRYRPCHVAPHTDELYRRAARWAADHLAGLADADPGLPEALHDRAQDNWRALIAIADAAGGEWPERARAAALALSGADATEDKSRGVMLLSDIRAVFRDRGCTRIASSDLSGALGRWKIGRGQSGGAANRSPPRGWRVS